MEKSSGTLQSDSTKIGQKVPGLKKPASSLPPFQEPFTKSCPEPD
jgi:hypothetical protein